MVPETACVVWGEYVLLADNEPPPWDNPTGIKYVHDSYARDHIAGKNGYAADAEPPARP